MNAVNLAHVIRLADQLSAEERAALMQHLQMTLSAVPPERVTRDMLLAELEQLRAQGAFDHVESLRNQYTEPPLNLTDAELRASLREISNEWESDIDNLFADG
jgi:hypothetical protein